MSATFNDPIFNDENKAREALESIRWPNGPVCVHCGAAENIVRVEGVKKSHRPGLLYCNHCKGQFTVTVGTVFERSKVPLTKWWLATTLICSSKKGMSSHQLSRMLGVTYKTAWFMSHRIRHAMQTPGGLMGSSGGVVEADETYIGKKPGRDKRAGHGHKQTVFALVERPRKGRHGVPGQIRSFHLGDLKGNKLRDALWANVSHEARLVTDDGRWYKKIAKRFKSHEVVKHSKGEYVRGDVYTNTIEGAFSVFKRGMIGVYQHCGPQHLQRYLCEFDFRYNNRAKLGVDDTQRTINALKGIDGKRLTYRQPHQA